MRKKFRIQKAAHLFTQYEEHEKLTQELVAYISFLLKILVQVSLETAS